jgi:hypothetical protein
MGRRSRKRSEGPAVAPAQPPPAPRRAPAPPTRKARLQDAPQAPWSPFPLVELTILIGIVLIVLGFVGVGDRRGLFLICGFALVSLAALELSLREHFAGYRSHTSLLAGLAGFIAGALAVAAGTPKLTVLIIAVAVGLATFPLLRRAFKRRSGGLGFRA